MFSMHKRIPSRDINSPTGYSIRRDSFAMRHDLLLTTLFQFGVLLVVLVVAVGLSFIPLYLHKEALEHIVGHSVTWWDAFWTH